MKLMLAIICVLIFIATGTAVTDYIEGESPDYVEPAYILVEDGIIYILDEDIVSMEVQNVMPRM